MAGEVCRVVSEQQVASLIVPGSAGRGFSSYIHPDFDTHSVSTMPIAGFTKVVKGSVPLVEILSKVALNTAHSHNF